MRDDALESDRRHMLEALELARAGWGRVQPNPLVGAVVVRDGVVVGRGAHREFGGPHAEIEALREAGAAARGATLYVTLEPCDHHGKTPPCTSAILEAGVGRVVFATADPDPLAGGGARRLRSAGVEVSEGVERRAARRLNGPFLHAIEGRGSWLALKYALSLDARLARTPGRATVVSGEEAHADVHHLRAGFDALMVGIGTVIADDPRLTVRGALVPRTPPIRVVLDSTLRLPPTSRLARTTDEAPTWVVTANDARGDEAALTEAGVRVLRVPGAPDGHGLDPRAVLDALRAEDVRAVLCEGGGTVGAAFLRADVVERLWLYLAPVLLGDAGPPAFPGAFPEPVDAGWAVADVSALGRDVKLQLDRVREGD